MKRKKFPQVKRVGLIATTGTVRSKIYDKALETIDVEVISPPSELQDTVMEAIYRYVKTGHLEEGRKIIINIAKYLARKRAEMIISGCTEVSLVLKSEDLSIPVIDPLQILSEAAVATALGRSN